jgi:RHS repeat-associated protein
VEQINGSTMLWLHHDQLGSTRLVTDSSGGSQAAYTFDAYGKMTASTGTVTNPLRFAGQYQDTESGLYYLRARYYDPATGQFITRDRWTPATRKPYAYTDDNPLNGSDPTGLYDCGWQPWNCVRVDNLFNPGSWGSQITANWSNEQARDIAIGTGLVVGTACALGGCMAAAAEGVTAAATSIAWETAAAAAAIVTGTGAIGVKIAGVAIDAALSPRSNIDNATNTIESQLETSCPLTNPDYLSRIPHEIRPAPSP